MSGIRKLGLLVVIAALLVFWTYYDNNHIVVCTQMVALQDLPPSFDGFTILQISDLHGKVFGQHQSALLKMIRDTPHDLIIFTGDMNAGYDTEINEAVLDLIVGLSGETMYWVDGNCGPYAVYSIYGSATDQLTPSGVLLEQLGVHVLTEPVQLTRGSASVFLTPKFSLMQIQDNLSISSRKVRIEGIDWEKLAAYYATLQQWYDKLTRQDQIIIAIAHFPEQDYQAEFSEQIKPLPYDLMICGHTHGGQIRLPFLGAIYIPTASTNRGGWFPADKDTHGLSSIMGVQQYISAGLGASHSNPLLSFRFNCAPEINQIIFSNTKDTELVSLQH